jgi:hypothetical protein
MKLSIKIFSGTLFALAGMLLGLPLLIGLALQWAAPGAVLGLDQQLAAFSVRLIAIERHWFSTELTVGLEPTDGSADLTYQSELLHGPWPLRRPTWLQGRGRLVHPELATVGEDQWRLSPRLNLSAEIRSDWQRKAAGQQMDLALRLHANRQMSQISLQLLPSAVRFPGQLHASALRGQGQFERDQHNNWQLELQLDADTLGDGQWPELLTNPALNLRLSAAQDTLGLATEITLDALEQGEHHNYQQVVARMTLGNLHRLTLANWLEAALAAHRSGLRGQFLVEKTSGDLLLALPALLAQQPEFELQSLQLDSSRGAAELVFRLGLPSAPPPGFLLNPLVLIEVAAAQGALQLSQALAHHWATLQARAELGVAANQAAVNTAADDFLLRLRANQLLLGKGSDYHLEMALSEGELTLNGQSMYLPTF